MLGPSNTPVCWSDVDSLRIEWGKPPEPYISTVLTDEEQEQLDTYAALPPQPTLLLTGPAGRLRIFIPDDFVEALPDGNFDALLFALFSRQIDRLPWPLDDLTDGQDGFVKVKELKR